MKKKLMAVLTASSVAAMAAGATLAAYAEPNQGPQYKDDDETYVYDVNSSCLFLNTFDGFEKWKADTRINRNDIKKISFDNFSNANGGEIPAGAFEGLTSIESVQFNNSISKIGDNAFKGCTSITEVVFDKSESDVSITIGKSAFEGCTSISELDFRETAVVEIGESAFKGCTSISKLVFYSWEINQYGSVTARHDSHVKKIGKSAFQDCTGLLDIVFGNALKEIGESAFEGCINLGKTDPKPNEETNGTDIIIWLHGISFGNKSDSSLETIGNRAFYGCEKLTAFGFPEKIKTIGEYAFANCASLHVADMWECRQLESIEKYAFFNCLSLTQVDFPNSRIYANGGHGYNSAFPKHTIAEGAFRNCSWLEGVILSPYVGNVAPGAFYKCKNLKYIGYYYYVNDFYGIGNNVEIKVDTEHSTQDPPNPPQNSKSAVDKQSLSLLAASGEDSETVTIYVPPEVTVFSFDTMGEDEKSAVKETTAAEMFWEKMAEEHPGLTYDGQIVTNKPRWKYENEYYKEPEEPVESEDSYWSFYPNLHRVWYGDGEEYSYDDVMALYEEEHKRWEEEKAQYEQEKEVYDNWIDFLQENGVNELWDGIWDGLYSRFSRPLYRVTLINEPTSKDGTPLKTIVLPEKFNSDADIYSITVNGSVDIVDLPVNKKYYNYMNYYYYDFSKMEAMGYEFVANPYLGSAPRTFRSESDIYDPKNSGLYGNNSGETLIREYPVVPTGPYDDFGSSSSSSEPSTTTSPENPTPPVNTSNPPSPPPPSNTDDPIEPDPESSESESSEPESSEPESSESGSSEPGSSDPSSSKPNPGTPDSNPNDNPGTGVCFLAPIALVGAATVAVAARRRKMK